MLIPVTAYPLYARRGLGASVVASTGVTLGTGAAVGVLEGLHAAGAIGGSIAGGIAAGALSFGIGAAAALVLAFLSRQGPKQKVATTQLANQVEPLMQQNLAAWNASAKTCADQAVALATWDSLWNALVNACANPSLGDPGHSCIDDRLPAGVQFEYNTFHLVGNGMYNWKAYYRDPIANDPAASGCCPTETCFYPNCTPPASSCVPQSASSGANAVAGVTLPGGVSLSALAIPAALLALLWAVS